MKVKGIPISCIAGVCIALFYIVFTAISIVYYPKASSPFTTYLSDYGNMKVSPTGSFYYNVGCIITGLSVLPFYIGLIDWYSNKSSKYLLMLGQLLGIASGVALSFIGVYPEDFPSQHRFWSSTFFGLNFFAMLTVNTALYLSGNFSKRVAVYGYIIQFITLISFILQGGSAIVEWFTVFSSIGYALLLSLETWYNSQDSKLDA
ncbi:DUF998 domain-containing protein [Candidatus Bathyarchaeota archaeon]|nr:DUF998 domain-containing protein [Candidatus Bathyarchaeota archaeon]